MIKKAQLALFAAVAAFALASPVLAQSDYTTGTEASDVRHGYPSPYGHHGHRHGLYAYAPGWHDHAQVRQWRDQSGDDYR